MTDASPSSALSSTYWELHRNTLLFSALLLVICIPGAHPDTKQSFLWLSFSDVAFNSVRLIAFCAATYAFLTYLLEWRTEPYSILRRENDLAATSRDRAEQLVQDATSKLQPVLGHFRHIIANAEDAMNPFIRNDETHTPDEISAIVNSSFDELSQNMQHHGNPMNTFLRNVGRHDLHQQPLTTQYVTEHGREAIKQTALMVATNSCSKVSRESTVRLKTILQTASNAADNLQQSLDELSNSKTGLFYISTNAKRAIYLYRTKSWARVMLVGLAVPALLYVTAIAHLAGQLGWGYLPSLFSLIQKPAATAPAKDAKPPASLAPASTKG